MTACKIFHSVAGMRPSVGSDLSDYDPHVVMLGVHALHGQTSFTPRRLIMHMLGDAEGHDGREIAT